MGQTDREVARTSTRPMRIIDKTSYEQVRGAGNSTCGGLCVRATLEEDKDHKDIRVRISDTSACSNYDNNKNKATIVKFCTPLVCKEQSQREPSGNEIIADEAANSSSMISAESREIREENNVELPNLSSRINENLENDENPSYRHKESNEQDIKLATSVETKTAVRCTDDDTPGYNVPKSPKCFCQDTENVDKNETRAKHDTLINLRKVMEDAAQADMVRGRNKYERSRSVPRGRSRERDFDYAKSNLSFPVCVDYREAALTATDLTRPEFVQTLTEIKEYARNLEKQLSRMNSAMRNTICNDCDKNKNALFDTAKEDPSSLLDSSVSSAGIVEKEKKSRKKKKKDKDASSQSDIFRDESVSTASLKKTKKSDLESAAKIHDEETPSVKAQKSSLTFMRRREGFMSDQLDLMKPSQHNKLEDRPGVLGNQKSFVRSNEASSSGTQTSLRRSSEFLEPTSIANEAVMVKPSKIHKLKKTTEFSREKITCLDDPKNFACANERLSPGVLRSPTKPDDMSLSVIGKSFPPKHRQSPEKPKSASTQSSETRTAVATSVADLHLRAPPTTPIDNERESGLQRDRQTSCFSLKRSSPSQSRSKNHKNEISPSHDKIRSQSANSDKIVSVDEIEGTRTAPKPVASKTLKKSAKLGSTNGKLLPRESEVSCNRNTCDSLSRISPGIARIYDQSGQSRPTDNSSQSRKLDKRTSRIFDRRTPVMEYSRAEKSVIDNRRRSPSRYGKSPTTRSRKADTTEELSLGNYPSNSKRLGVVKTPSNVNGKLNNNSTSNSDKKPKLHQRSRSDPRETHNYAGRNSR